MTALAVSPATVTSPAAAAPSYPPYASWLRRMAGPIALVAGPVLGTAGMAIHPPGADDDTALAATIAAHSGRWFASHLLLGIGWALLAVGLASASRLARGRGAPMTTFGATVGAVGAAVMSLADITHGVVAYALAGQVSPARSIAIQTAYFRHPVVFLIMMGAMLLPAGVLVLGAAVLRSRAVPRWAGIVLLVSPVVVQAAGAAGPGEIVCGIPLIVGTTVLARSIARA